jgi:nucleotide-binding universal stress UspA family protein
LRLEERAREKMDDLIAPYQSGEARLEERIVYGNRTQAILEFAADYGIDLIVMSSHQVDPDDPATGWGTISYKVGILAACPIMLVK